MITLEDTKDYLGVSDNESDAMIQGMIGAARIYLRGSIGPNYDESDPRAELLVKMTVNDMYFNRGIHNDGKVSGNIRRLVDDFSMQMRLEGRE